jgi:beta-lactam-binding protein with PASTA domain
VVIPSTLTGLLFPDVGAELNALGLKYMLVPQIDNDPSMIPNTVLSTDPSAGSAVAPGTVVKVIYAARSVSASPTTAAQ